MTPKAVTLDEMPGVRLQRAGAAIEDAAMIEDPAGRIEYDEAGSGPTVVLIPGSCSTGAAWRPVIGAWGDTFRTVTTSLLGYGETAERRKAGETDIAIHAEAIEAVIRRAGEPVHAVAHSFGGLALLAVALRRKVELASLTIIETPAIELLRAAGEHEHYEAFRSMSETFFAGVERGEQEAISVLIDFYGGAGTFASWPPRLRAYTVETTPVILRDWQTAYGFPLTPGILGTLRLPSLLMFGENGHPAVKRANALIAASIPGGIAEEVPGAAHFMIGTHGADVARRVANHIGGAIRGCV